MKKIMTKIMDTTNLYVLNLLFFTIVFYSAKQLFSLLNLKRSDAEFFTFFSFAIIGYSLLVTVIWAVFNLLDNSILERENKFSFYNFMIQIGNIIILILGISFVLMILVLLSQTLFTIFFISKENMLYVEIILGVLMIIPILYFCHIYYIVSFTHEFTNAILSLFEKEIIKAENIIKFILLGFVAVALYFIIALMPNLNTKFTIGFFVIPLIISYIKVDMNQRDHLFSK